MTRTWRDCFVDLMSTGSCVVGRFIRVDATHSICWLVSCLFAQTKFRIDD